jgi:hypothetical protein
LNYFNYFSEIEETFVRRRGKNLFLSPLDWAMIEAWQEREIPLHIILRGIENVFDNYEKSKKKRSIKSLAFCSEEIEAQFEEWQDSQIGKNVEIEETEDEMFSDKTIKNHLEKLNVELVKLKQHRYLEEVVGRIIPRLNELNTNFQDAETLENSLNDLEKLLDEVLLENAEKDVKKEIETSMASYKNQMTSEVYQRTFELMLLKKIKENLEIPRFSLFYL